MLCVFALINRRPGYMESGVDVFGEDAFWWNSLPLVDGCVHLN